MNYKINYSISGLCCSLLLSSMVSPNSQLSPSRNFSLFPYQNYVLNMQQLYSLFSSPISSHMFDNHSFQAFLDQGISTYILCNNYSFISLKSSPIPVLHWSRCLSSSHHLIIIKNILSYYFLSISYKARMLK